MDKKTIYQLNQLNLDFYTHTAKYFNSSRQYFWQGWQKLLEYIPYKVSDKRTINILDVGCGNGRFGQFISENFEHELIYTGVDSSVELLAAAKQSLESLKNPQLQYTLLKKDIVSACLNDSLTSQLSPQSHDLITLFGVWHHIPSSNLRISLLKQLTVLLKPGGLIIFTAWKFNEYDRFQKKIVSPQKANLHPTNLEEHDYILDWKRGTHAYRYCHYSPNSEITNVIKNIPNLELLSSFRADGKEENVNQYLILQKSVQ